MLRPVFKTLTLLLLVFTVAACGKSETEKAQDDAKNLLAEQNQLLSYFQSAGSPDLYWPLAKLNSYEKKLNRLDAVNTALLAYDGKHGISVVNSKRSSVMIKVIQLRSSLQLAKDLRKSIENMDIDGFTGDIEKQTSRDFSEYEAMQIKSKKVSALANKIDARGMPDESWKLVELVNSIEDLQKLHDSASELEGLYKKTKVKSYLITNFGQKHYSDTVSRCIQDQEDAKENIRFIEAVISAKADLANDDAQLKESI